MESRFPPDFYSSAVSFGTNRSQRIAVFCVLSAQKDCRFLFWEPITREIAFVIIRLSDNLERSGISLGETL